jgi:ribosomal protein S27AE
MKVIHIINKPGWKETRPGIWHRTTKRKWKQIYYEKSCEECGDRFVASHKKISHCGKSCSGKNNNLGEKSHFWNGGKFIDSRGYVNVLKRDHPHAMKPNFYIKEHRLIAENKLGRYLKKGEVVHHINGIKHDNRPENLVVMTPSQHSHHHNSQKSQQKKRCS